MNYKLFLNVVCVILLIILLYDENYNYNDSQYKKPKKNKYLKSCKAGMITGFVAGCVTGDFDECIKNAASYGLVNPTVLYITQ